MAFFGAAGLAVSLARFADAAFDDAFTGDAFIAFMAFDAGAAFVAFAFIGDGCFDAGAASSPLPS